MQTDNNIFDLLHDTYLNETKFYKNNWFCFVFNFSLDDDKIYTVELVNKVVANIVCKAVDRNMQEVVFEIKDLKDIYFVKAERVDKNMEILFDDVLNNRVIKLNYTCGDIKIEGDLDKLKAFWDICV